MPGGKGNIRAEDGKQFSSEYQPPEKWTEEKALELGNDLIKWLLPNIEQGKDKNSDHIFYEEFLCIENNYYEELIAYLCGKFTSFLNLIKRAKKIQELKLCKWGTGNKLNPGVTIFCLKNHHNYKDKKDITTDGKPLVTSDKDRDAILKKLKK